MAGSGYIRFAPGIAGDTTLFDPEGRLRFSAGDLCLIAVDTDGQVVAGGGPVAGYSFEDIFAGMGLSGMGGSPGGTQTLSVTMTVERDVSGGARIRIALTNQSDRPVRLSHVSFETGPGGEGPLLEGDMSGWARYKMGFNTGAASGAAPLSVPDRRFFMRGLPVSMLPAPVRKMLYYDGTEFSRKVGQFESEWFTAVFDTSARRGMLFGFCGVGRHFSRVKVDLPGGTMSLTAFMDGAEVAPGATRELDPIIVMYGSDFSGLLEDYARAVAAENGARVNPARIWCSWYSGFYDRVTVSDIRENMRRIARLDSPVEYIQLDDGYQSLIGDWLKTNKRFPEGLEALACEIREAGFKPGIWTAPFSVSPDSSVYAEHPDWVVRNRNGKPVKAGFIMGKFGPRPYFALDTTIPEARAHVTSLYARLRQMGWHLFKIDFLTSAMVEGVRRDSSKTRAEAYRMGMQAVRDGVGEDGLILTGIGPFLANTGIIDIQRLSPDTCFGSPAWITAAQRVTGDRMTPGVRNQTSVCIGRAFTNDILWSGDPDAIVGPGLSETEATYLKTVALMTGSTLTIGHDFQKARFDFAGYGPLVAARGPASVRDMGVAEFPRHLTRDAEIDGRPVTFYALLNQDDAPASLQVRGEIFGKQTVSANDYWAGTGLTLKSGARFELGPRSARLFVFDRIVDAEA